jgi:hypothetical protein
MIGALDLASPNHLPSDVKRIEIGQCFHPARAYKASQPGSFKHDQGGEQGQKSPPQKGRDREGGAI